MGLLDKIQSKLEIYRLEQRYTRRKNRTTFTTGAQYVDGEYVYPPDSTTNSSPASSSPMSLSKHSTGSAERDFWRAPMSFGSGSGNGNGNQAQTQTQQQSWESWRR